MTQKRINGWIVDFYIKSIDTYVQFDGVYWHGLDRTLKELKASKSPRDIMIRKARARDRKQDRWFKANGKRLVRVTDREFTESNFDMIVERIKK